MYHGSCLCGDVQFEISGAIQDIVCCHCSECRRAQGSAFATNGNVLSEDFKFISGENQLNVYPASENLKKYFCKKCGSPVMSKFRDKPQYVRIRVGSITSNISERPVAHVFVASKADWDVIPSDIPHFDEYLIK